jgi:hypothetical protein
MFIFSHPGLRKVRLIQRFQLVFYNKNEESKGKGKWYRQNSDENRIRAMVADAPRELRWYAADAAVMPAPTMAPSTVISFSCISAAARIAVSKRRHARIGTWLDAVAILRQMTSGGMRKA